MVFLTCNNVFSAKSLKYLENRYSSQCNRAVSLAVSERKPLPLATSFPTPPHASPGMEMLGAELGLIPHQCRGCRGKGQSQEAAVGAEGCQVI